MTQDDIIEMARQAGFDEGLVLNVYPNFIQRFAKLVADAAVAKEREACAKVCEDYTDNDGVKFIDDEGHGYECAAAIRARGEA